MGCAFVHADVMHIGLCQLEAGGAAQLRDAECSLPEIATQSRVHGHDCRSDKENREGSEDTFG